MFSSYRNACPNPRYGRYVWKLASDSQEKKTYSDSFRPNDERTSALHLEKDGKKDVIYVGLQTTRDSCRVATRLTPSGTVGVTSTDLFQLIQNEALEKSPVQHLMLNQNTPVLKEYWREVWGEVDVSEQTRRITSYMIRTSIVKGAIAGSLILGCAMMFTHSRISDKIKAVLTGAAVGSSVAGTLSASFFGPAKGRQLAKDKASAIATMEVLSIYEQLVEGYEQNSGAALKEACNQQFNLVASHKHITCPVFLEACKELEERIFERSDIMFEKDFESQPNNQRSLMPGRKVASLTSTDI